MAYTVTEEITYSGSEFDVTVLSPLEMFQLYKTEHSVAESATTAFNNATGLTSVDVSKPSDSVCRHVSVWADPPYEMGASITNYTSSVVICNDFKSCIIRLRFGI